MKKHTWIVLLFMAIVPLACKLPGWSEKNPLATIPVSTQAVKTMEANLEDTIKNTSHGSEFQIAITEQQLTSYLALKLQANPDYPVHDLRIYLRDGKIRVIGTVDQANMAVQAEFIVRPFVEANRLQYDVISAKIGPFNLPQTFIEAMEQEMQSAFEEQLQSLDKNYQIDSVVIQDGVMTLKGIKN